MLRELSWAWLADNFKSGSTLAAGLICPPLVYSMTDSCDAKFGHSPMNIKSWGDDDWIFHMWDSQPDNILFWVCSQIVIKINESCILYRSEVQSVHITKVGCKHCKWDFEDYYIDICISGQFCLYICKICSIMGAKSGQAK